MSVRLSQLPILAHTASGRKAIVEDFIPSMKPVFKLLISFTNLGFDVGALSEEDANDFGNKRAQELLANQLDHYLKWSGNANKIRPDDLNSLINDVTDAAEELITVVTAEYAEHMEAEEATVEVSGEADAEQESTND